MTSRLKRKLGELGVDTSSRRANENFCLIGTPLPPLEKSKDTGEFVPLWKQEVRDDKGRRRLHGAFTGGWSAGYFNTVGSEQGWAPSAFVSSRSDRVKKQTARPEDFMDEEDLQDLKDSRKIVDTTEEMDFMGSTQAELRSKNNDEETEPDPIQATLQATLLPTPKFSIGARILQKMGWRAGQGIGPRVSLARRRAQDVQAYDPFTGTRLTKGSLDIPDEDEEAKNHLYAPRDVSVLTVQRKDNAHGLGYVPGTTLHSTSDASTSGSQGAFGPRLAGGFGLGALNEADDDDLDFYDSLQHPSSSRRRVAYDHKEGVDDDDTVLLGSSSAGKRKGTSASHATTPSSHFRDGKAVLQGFILSGEPVAQDKWFSLPEVPQGWKPNPRHLWDGNKESTTISPPATTHGEAQSHAKWKNAQLSADQRGSLLGEAPLPPGPPRSVFEYMSAKDKERIQRIAASLVSGKATSTPGDNPSVSSTSVTMPPPPATTPMVHIEPHVVAQAALMQGRFMKASVLDLGFEVIGGLHQPSSSQSSDEKDAGEKAEREKEAEANVDPKVHAAKMGLYGPLTREAKPWIPARLLCKRFGVRDPDVSLAEVAKPGQPSESVMTPSSSSSAAAGAGMGANADDVTRAGAGGGPRDITNLGLGEDDMQGRDILTYQRPPVDVFKAIFASDDEDDDDGDDSAEPVAGYDGKGDEGMAGNAGPFTSATVVLEDDKPVDLETFKPQFVPRKGGKDKKKDREREKESNGEKKHKGEKKKRDKGKEKKVLVSFELDEGETREPERSAENQPAKKKRRKERRGGGEQRGDGDALRVVDTSPPDCDEVNQMTAGANSIQLSTNPGAVTNKGRKRAVDFMD